MTPWQALSWDVRSRVPAFLRAAGLDEQADAMASLPEITSLRVLADAKRQAHEAARAAFTAWKDRKPPNGSHACTAVRQAAYEAKGITLLPSAGLTLPIAVELRGADDASLQADAAYAASEFEVAAEWAAALVACGEFECEDSETWTIARARLAPVIVEVMKSWQG